MALQLHLLSLSLSESESLSESQSISNSPGMLSLSLSRTASTSLTHLISSLFLFFLVGLFCVRLCLLVLHFCFLVETFCFELIVVLNLGFLLGIFFGEVSFVGSKISPGIIHILRGVVFLGNTLRTFEQ